MIFPKLWFYTAPLKGYGITEKTINISTNTKVKIAYKKKFWLYKENRMA